MDTITRGMCNSAFDLGAKSMFNEIMDKASKETRQELAKLFADNELDVKFDLWGK